VLHWKSQTAKFDESENLQMVHLEGS